MLLFSIMMLNIGGNARAQDDGEGDDITAEELKSALESDDVTPIKVTKSITLNLTNMLKLGASHTLIINQDQTVTINGGGTLVSKRERGNMLYGLGGQLSLENITVNVDKASINVPSITVGDGATINLDAPETEQPLKTFNLTVKEGGTINIKSFKQEGINLSVSGALTIESGGKVYVGAGSHNNHGIHSTGRIELEEGGTLKGNKGGAIYLAEGSRVKCGSGLFSDQKNSFASSENNGTEVVADGTPVVNNQLTEGFYQWNNGLFAKTDPESGWELDDDGALTISSASGMWNWRMYKNKTFGSTESVTSVTITDDVTKILDGVFFGCENLASVSIPATVTSIGENAFGATYSLTAITIPALVTEIGAMAFDYSSLASVTFEGDTPPIIAADAFSDCANLSKIIVPTGTQDAYQAAVGEGLKEKVVEGTAIEEGQPSTVDGGILIGDGQAIASEVTVTGDVTFENVKTQETKVGNSETSTLTLTGNNDLGAITVGAGGNLTLDIEAGATVTVTSVANSGTFTDNTGSVKAVTGDASLNLTGTGAMPSDQTAEEQVTLTVTPTVADEADAVTYQWQKQDNGNWTDVNNPYTRAATTGNPSFTTSITGIYRCRITVRKDAVITTLLTTSATATVQPKSDSGSSEQPYEPTYHTVTLPAVEGAVTDPVAGDYDVESWSTFRFYLTIDEDYNQSQPVVTTDRGETISPRSSEGAYLVKYVRNDVAITISGVVKNPDPVANAELHTGSTITARDGLLLITTNRPTEAQVIALTGQLIRSLALPSGTTRIDGLADGIYIVRLSDGTVQKVIVRK